MKNKIYNELNHQPLVWGVPFASLMMMLSSLVAGTTLFISIMPVWKGILTAFLLNGVIYLASLKYSGLDKIELYGRWQKAIKKNIDSLNKSSQALIIK